MFFTEMEVQEEERFEVTFVFFLNCIVWRETSGFDLKSLEAILP